MSIATVAACSSGGDEKAGILARQDSPREDDHIDVSPVTAIDVFETVCRMQPGKMRNLEGELIEAVRKGINRRGKAQECSK